MRELIRAEIQAKAEIKIPGYLEGQENYAKRYRVQVHQWSHGRLIDHITSQASKLDITVEEEQQQPQGNPQEQAKLLAIRRGDLAFSERAAYRSRLSA